MDHQTRADLIHIGGGMLPKPIKDEYTRSTAMTADTNVAVRMRDGTILCADVFRPARGRYPVLLSRIPYGKHRAKYHALYLDPVRAVSRGYAVVIQDVRGRHMSAGEFYPFRDEGKDGFDTVEWCAAQPWSDGNVGMFGISYHGATQWLAAVEAPPSLKAIAPGVTSDSYYDSWLYQGGALNAFFAYAWAGDYLVDDFAGIPAEKAQAFAELRRLRQDPLAMVEHLPLNEMPSLRGLADYYYDWLAHPTWDDYWKGVSPRERFNKVQVPALNIGGWYDGFLRGTVRCYEGMRNRGGSALARDQQHLLLGPWKHEPMPDPVAGERYFGAHASGEAIDIHGLMLAWFDRWLKDEGNGVDTDPAVYYFTMGEDAWHSTEAWPPPDTKTIPYFLGSRGRANTLWGDGTLSRELSGEADAPDHYAYDPRNPVSTLGGPHLFGLPGIFVTGVQDQKPVEVREDVLVYTSEPLERDLEVTGNVSLSLWAISSAPDTDWTAKLVDVQRDGRAYNVCEGILRASYRESLESPMPITPGEPYEYEIDLGPTSMLFKRGHRIRLQVSSSNFPAHTRNLNTGRPHHDEAEPRTAAQTVLHDAEHPSNLALPATWR